MQAGTDTLENKMEVLKTLNTELSYVPPIALLGIYPIDTE